MKVDLIVNSISVESLFFSVSFDTNYKRYKAYVAVDLPLVFVVVVLEGWGFPNLQTGTKMFVLNISKSVQSVFIIFKKTRHLNRENLATANYEQGVPYKHLIF